MAPTTVFVGGLPEDCRERDVEDFFAKSKYGRIKSIRLRHGFGFVDFDDSRDADDCMADLDGERMLGARISLDIAKSTYQRGYVADRSDRRSNKSIPYRTDYIVEIENLSSTVTWMDLRKLFERVGEVTCADANERSGRNRGEICFRRREDMQRAMRKFDGEDLNGRRIRLSIPKVGRKGSRSPSSSRSRSRSRSARRRSRSRSTRRRSRSRSTRRRSRSRSRGGGRRGRSDSRDKKKVERKGSRSASSSRSRSRSRSTRRRSRSRSQGERRGRSDSRDKKRHDKSRSASRSK